MTPNFTYFMVRNYYYIITFIYFPVDFFFFFLLNNVCNNNIIVSTRRRCTLNSSPTGRATTRDAQKTVHGRLPGSRLRDNGRDDFGRALLFCSSRMERARSTRARMTSSGRSGRRPRDTYVRLNTLT